MGMIIDCFLVGVKMTDDSDRKDIIKQALKNTNDNNHQYGIEIPDDMAMILDHTGHIERYYNNINHMVMVRCYKIDWDETERVRQSYFKFGD